MVRCPLRHLAERALGERQLRGRDARAARKQQQHRFCALAPDRDRQRIGGQRKPEVQRQPDRRGVAGARERRDDPRLEASSRSAIRGSAATNPRVVETSPLDSAPKNASSL